MKTNNRPIESNRPIGGFFELELPQAENLYHENALALSTGRACLMVALDHIRPKRAFVPHYTCDATLEPFRQQGIDLVFYQLDNSFAPQGLPRNDNASCLLLTNYWGLNRRLLDRFEATFQNRLIVDNTHDYFHRPVDNRYWSFTSARKWFGVPDGAFLYSPEGLTITKEIDSLPANYSITLEPALARSLGQLDRGYKGFQQYELSLDCSANSISDYTKTILSLLDHQFAADRRRSNFDRLQRCLGLTNQLSAVRESEAVPFCYPYLPNHEVDRQRLHANLIFVPQLWTDAGQRAPNSSNAKRWTSDLLPLPVDQRYSQLEMDRIAATVLQREAAA